MKLVRLIYASRLNPNTDEKELARIHKKARVNNPKRCITGLSLVGDNQFMQCIEGSSSSVNELFSIISRDPRHDTCTLLYYSEIDHREFANWSMKFILLTDKNVEIILKFAVSCIFEPINMSGPSALALLMSLRPTT
jgi:hypothetical protein